MKQLLFKGIIRPSADSILIFKERTVPSSDTSPHWPPHISNPAKKESV
jgi:hypothetical protein